jgi:hypothetical protein
MRSLKGTTAFDKYGNHVLAAVRGNGRPAVFPSHGAKLFKGDCWVIWDPYTAHADPSEWATKYASAIGLDVKVARLAQSRTLRLPIPLDDKVVAAEQRLANQMGRP